MTSIVSAKRIGCHSGEVELLDHEKRLLGQLVDPFRDEGAAPGERRGDRHVLARAAGELLGQEERLGQEGLEPPRPPDHEAVLGGELLDAEDREQVQQEFRLPKATVQREVEYLQKLGVELTCDFVVGETRTSGELMEQDGYDAVSIGVGNVAMDSVRTALRLGAENAYIVYRRGMEEPRAARPGRASSRAGTS